MENLLKGLKELHPKQAITVNMLIALIESAKPKKEKKAEK